MFKRLFFALLGLGAGVAVGVWAVRKLEEAQKRLTPEYAARAAGSRLVALRGRLAAAVEEGRRAAAEREAELRGVYRGHEASSAPPAPGSTPPAALGVPPASPATPTAPASTPPTTE